MERVLIAERPDRLLVLGDTNSGLASVIAKRMGIPVYHMEAGNRCYDDRVPEEINRRIIDHSSDVLRCPIPRGVVPIWCGRAFRANHICNRKSDTRGASALRSPDPQLADPGDLGLEPQRYFLATVHRARMSTSSGALPASAPGCRLGDTYGLPVIVSTHPHTRARMGDFGMMPTSDPFSAALRPLRFRHAGAECRLCAQ